MEASRAQRTYRATAEDRVRAEMETTQLAATARRLLDRAPGGRVLELGASSGIGPLLEGHGLESYTGVDFRPPDIPLPGSHVLHDLGEGLGPVGRRPFHLYLACFGLASHLTPTRLRRLLAQIAAHARPGALVAVEALGLFSLEWPGLWDTAPGPARTLPYRLGADVPVHPWGAAELSGLLESAGIRPAFTSDRTLQAGPKLDEATYWPGLPPLRGAMETLLRGGHSHDALSRPLPPLPASAAAAFHHRLADLRATTVAAHRGPSRDLAHALWALERGSGGGFGHGVLAVGRVA
jgi:hypothetical protein